MRATLIFITMLAACGGSDGAPDGGARALDLADPFTTQADESEGLTNVSADLDAVLENGALASACDQYRAGATDKKTMLLCGKWMFFYETFGTAGIPAALVKFFTASFPDELGIGFQKLGMILDPSSADRLPFGFAPTTPFNGTIDSLAFTCASCHFAKLPDGRYAVGAPNLGYDYGTHILAITVVPTVALGLSKATDHDAAAIAKVQPLLDKLAADSLLRTQLTFALLPLASLQQATIPTDEEHDYATWPTGTQDFVMKPLPIDDGVHVVGKMIDLWGLPRPDEIALSGMTSAMLGWSGDARSPEEFVRGFAALGGVSTALGDDQIKPLVEYIYSLRAPANPSPPDAALVQNGAALFAAKGCRACHDGPRGSGKRTYGFDEVGTDSALARWADPDLTGTACCGLGAAVLTHEVKSPRTVGMWTLDRYLHNGTLSTLDELFCMGAGRPAVGMEPLRTDGHTYTCDGLSDPEKSALIAYLLAH